MKTAVDIFIARAVSYAGCGQRNERTRYQELLANDDESLSMANAMVSMSSCALTWCGLIQQTLEENGLQADKRLTDPYVIGALGGPAVTYTLGIADDCGGLVRKPSRLPVRGEALYLARADGTGGEHVIACVVEVNEGSPGVAEAIVIEGGQFDWTRGNCILQSRYTLALKDGALFAEQKRVFAIMENIKVLAVLQLRLNMLEAKSVLYGESQLGDIARAAALEFMWSNPPTRDPVEWDDDGEDTQ